jgi:hypothetical protein
MFVFPLGPFAPVAPIAPVAPVTRKTAKSADRSTPRAATHEARPATAMASHTTRAALDDIKLGG